MRSWLLVAVMVLACKADPRGGVGESCTNRADCEDGLKCVAAVCVGPSDPEVPAAGQDSSCEGVDAFAGMWTINTKATESDHSTWIGGRGTYEVTLTNAECRLQGAGHRIENGTETWTLAIEGEVGPDGSAVINYSVPGRNIAGTWTIAEGGTGRWTSATGDVSGTLSASKGAAVRDTPPDAKTVLSGLRPSLGPFKNVASYCEEATRDTDFECGVRTGDGAARAEIADLGTVEVIERGDPSIMMYIGLAITTAGGLFVVAEAETESWGTEVRDFLERTSLEPDGRPGVVEVEFTFGHFERLWVDEDKAGLEQPTVESKRHSEVRCGLDADGRPGCTVAAE